MTPQEARMEGIAIVRDWIDDGKPGVDTILQQAILKQSASSISEEVHLSEVVRHWSVVECCMRR